MYVQKAVALLQTQTDAIDLRKENALVLKAAHMNVKHGDLLTIDELPIKVWDLWHRIKGVVLVDHNVPRSIYGNVTVLSIFDHHQDANKTLNAYPRIIEPSSSGSSLVVREIFRQRDAVKNQKDLLPLPQDLIDLLLRTIAMDTKGYKKSKQTEAEKEAIKRLWPLGSWAHEDTKHRMKKLFEQQSAAQLDLTDVGTRDLLRRDYKGDS